MLQPNSSIGHLGLKNAQAPGPTVNLSIVLSVSQYPIFTPFTVMTVRLDIYLSKSFIRNMYMYIKCRKSIVIKKTCPLNGRKYTVPNDYFITSQFFTATSFTATSLIVSSNNFRFGPLHLRRLKASPRVMYRCKRTDYTQNSFCSPDGFKAELNIWELI